YEAIENNLGIKLSGTHKSILRTLWEVSENLNDLRMSNLSSRLDLLYKKLESERFTFVKTKFIGSGNKYPIKEFEKYYREIFISESLKKNLVDKDIVEESFKNFIARWST